ncbi:MAG: hypothetical protein ACE5FM_09040, partial [Methyloligellaceae bacterium]
RLRPLLAQDRVIVVSDENVAPLYLGTLEKSLDGAGVKHASVILAAGEGTKDFDGLRELTEALLDGAVEVTNPGGTVVLDSPGIGTTIASPTTAPGDPVAWPQDKVGRAVASIAFQQ